MAVQNDSRLRTLGIISLKKEVTKDHSEHVHGTDSASVSASKKKDIEAFESYLFEEEKKGGEGEDDKQGGGGSRSGITWSHLSRWLHCQVCYRKVAKRCRMSERRRR